jgi:hypothetical protein
MLKKIVVGTLLVGLIGVLALGAINRTLAKTSDVAQAQGRVGGGNRYADGSDEQALTVRDRGGQPAAAAGGRVAQGNGQDREIAPGDQTGTGQAQVDEWLQKNGVVTSVNADVLVVQTADGKELLVENRGWWFAQDQGFSVQVGDEVILTGFFEGDDFEVGKIEDVTTGQTILLRNEDGRPMWAGRGRRGG